jgi:hypothetical protein
MAIIRYSDADRERMRQEAEELMEQRRREELYVDFLLETGRMRTADNRPMSEETMRKLTSLQLDPNKARDEE